MSKPNDKSPTPTVLQVGQMNFEGNIVPRDWYKQLTLPNGKPYLNAIIILAEIVFWYRPSAVVEEATGKPRGYERKFGGELLQRTYDSFADQFGLSKGQCQAAIKYLEDQGLITRVFRNIKTKTGLLLNNVLFIDLHVDRLREVTYPVQEQPISGSEDTPLPIERDISLDETPDITEITSENTSEITHHHHRKGQKRGGGVKGESQSAAKKQESKKDEDRLAREEFAFKLFDYVAPTDNDRKGFVGRLSDSQLNGLGAWLVLLKRDPKRLQELKSPSGYLRTKVLNGQYPDDEYASEQWEQGIELYKSRPQSEEYYDSWHEIFWKLRI